MTNTLFAEGLITGTFTTPWLKLDAAPKPVHVPRIDLSGFRVDKLKALAERNVFGDIIVRATMTVPAVAGSAPWPFGPGAKAGTPIEVYGDDSVSGQKWGDMSDSERAVFVKRAVMKVLEHELDEQLKLDGKYAFDPHGTRKPPQPLATVDLMMTRHGGKAPAPPKRRAIKPQSETNSKRVAGRWPEQRLVTPGGKLARMAGGFQPRGGR